MDKIKIIQSGIRDITTGTGVKIVTPSNLYECTLGDHCFIGPYVEIQKGVIIGNDCRIQSHCFICELVHIGNNCFISHGAKFINDPFSANGPAKGDRSNYKETTLGNNVSIGTNATILPVKICDNVVIGAGSVVTKDITHPGIYAGNPARLIKKNDTHENTVC